LYAYGSDKHLNMIGCFDADMKCAAHTAKAIEYVLMAMLSAYLQLSKLQQ